MALLFLVLLAAIVAGGEVVAEAINPQEQQKCACSRDDLAMVNTTLHAAAEMNSAQTVELLLSRGEDPNERDDNGRTSLHAAAAASATRAAVALLAGGAHVNWSDSQQLTPLHVAADAGSFGVVAALLAWGADPDFTVFTVENGTQKIRYSPTPLEIASKKGHAHIVELLLRAGASPSHPTSKHPYLHHAAKHGYIGVAIALLNGGAPIEEGSSGDIHGFIKTAVDVAAEHCHPGVTAALLVAGAKPVPESRAKCVSVQRILRWANRRGSTQQ